MAINAAIQDLIATLRSWTDLNHHAHRDDPVRSRQPLRAGRGFRTETFFRDLPVLTSFRDLADPRAYRAVPDDWTVGLTDVVRSTEAIQAGRYKRVNTAGAAVISALSNALGTLEFPYIFAGDGMCYVIDPMRAPIARRAVAACIAWVGEELGLTLRGGEVEVAAVRETGRDVRVARFAASPDVSYAMFSGGGVIWAEDELKAGRLASIEADPSARPNLDGLSCRFKPVQARHGLILSVIVSPGLQKQDARFPRLVSDLLRFIDESPDASLPVGPDSFALAWPPQGFVDEARLQRKTGEPLVSSLIRPGGYTLFSAVVLGAGRTLGKFSPRQYRQQLVANSDHRKFEDRLMMTVDCSPAVADHVEYMLAEAQRDGIADFGLHRQTTALITCVVPSPTRPNHVHFVDGAAGGYTLAARALKRARDKPSDAEPISPLALKPNP